MSRNSLSHLLLFVALAALALPYLAGPSTRAFAQQAGGSDLFAVTAPGQGQGQNVLFVIDPQSMRMAVYEHRAGGGKAGLKLTAVRNMEHELQFQEWPSPKAKIQVPSVEEIKKALEKKPK